MGQECASSAGSKSVLVNRAPLKRVCRLKVKEAKFIYDTCAKSANKSALTVTVALSFEACEQGLMRM